MKRGRGVGLAKCKAVIQDSMQITHEVGDGWQVVRALSQIMRHKLRYQRVNERRLDILLWRHELGNDLQRL